MLPPHEIYNLAAPSVVAASWDNPAETIDIVGMGALRLLESIRRFDPSIRFFQASSSEMFGLAETSPQCETTPFRPESPYAAAKAMAHAITGQYRQRYDLFACCGILFHHESPRRAPQFVTRKITQGVAAIVLGKIDQLTLGNLQARRDWGFAGDYILAMQRMLRHPEPGDYVIGTGQAHSVRDFAARAFQRVGLNWQDHVVVDRTLLRPNDPHVVVADPSRAREILQWQPKVTFESLVDMMVDSDLRAATGEFDHRSEYRRLRRAA